MQPTDTLPRLLNYWRKRYGMTPGGRNTNLLILAQWMNEHGVPIAEALAVCLPMQQEGFPAAEVRQVVESAYKRTAAGSNAWMNSSRTAPAPPPTPLRANPGFTLSPTQLSRLAQWQQQDRQRSSTAPLPLPPPPSVTSSTAPPVHSSTAPEPVAIVQGDERPAAEPVGTLPAELVYQRSTHDDGAVALLRCMQRKHPYTMALELYVQAGVNLTGARVAQLLRDMDNELGRSASI
jgi:hypothetical protein